MKIVTLMSNKRSTKYIKLLNLIKPKVMLRKILNIIFMLASIFSVLWLSACGHIDRKVELPNKKELAPIINPIKISKLLDRKIVNLQADYVLNSALTFATHQDRIFAADLNGDVIMVNAQSGKLISKVKLPYKVTAGPVWFEDGILVATENQQLFCINPKTKDLLWNITLSSDALALPKVAGKMIFVHTLDGSLSAISSIDGKQLWRVSTVVPHITLRRGSTPIVVDDQVIVGFANGKLFVLHKEQGTILWNRDLTMPKGRSELQRISDLVADPIVIDKIIYAVSYQGNLTAVDLKQGDIIWEKPLASYAGMAAEPSATTVGKLYIAGLDGKISAIDRKNGDIVWEQDELVGRTLSKPVLFKNYLIIGDQDGNLHVLDRLHGFIKGRINLNTTGIFITPVVDQQQNIQLLTNDGRLMILAITG